MMDISPLFSKQFFCKPAFYKQLTALSLFAALATPVQANQTYGAQFQVNVTIDPICSLQQINLATAALVYEGKGSPTSRATIYALSNSPHTTFFDVRYMRSNLVRKDGTPLVLGRDVFYTTNGSTPLLLRGNRFLPKLAPNGQWRQFIYLATAKGITAADLKPVTKPEVQARITLRCGQS